MDTLIFQVDSINSALLSLETQYAELEGRYLDLEQDRNRALHEVIKLHELLRLEKEKHKEATSSGITQFSAIQKQIGLLLKEVQHKDNQLQEEEHKIVEAQTEIFILQRCLGDMAEVNSDVLAQLRKQQGSRGES
jgi:chromosome segregation ATPase